MTNEFDQLKDMFPNLSDEQILENLKCFGSVAEAAFWLTSEEPPSTITSCSAAEKTDSKTVRNVAEINKSKTSRKNPVMN